MIFRREAVHGLVAAALCLLATTLTGCGSSSEETGYNPKGETLLREVWDMYKSHLDATRRHPTSLTDLDPYEPTSTYGYGALRDGEVVIFWGGAGGQVVAYEKQAPEQGGAVLFHDGTIRQVTAGELQSTLQGRKPG